MAAQLSVAKFGLDKAVNWGLIKPTSRYDRS